MINNYRRNHNLLTRRYCGYHKKRERQKKEKDSLNTSYQLLKKGIINEIYRL